MIVTNFAELLDAAAAIIEQVRNKLNSSKEPCPACGQDHFANWTERQAREQLNGTLTRLKRVKDMLLQNADDDVL